jgi:hypothetical protein
MSWIIHLNLDIAYTICHINVTLMLQSCTVVDAGTIQVHNGEELQGGCILIDRRWHSH